MTDAEKVNDLKKAMLCLFLECPVPVAEDVGEKAEAVIALVAHYQSKLALMESVVERARYLCYPSKHESPSEVCHECGTYGYGELRDALHKLDEAGKL